MIRVLIVDDSPTVRDALAYGLSKDPNIKVVGFAENGEEAINKVETLRPDVVTMDITMPGMDGIEATRRIMETAPVPIVIVSSCYNHEEVELSYKAIMAGAVAILPKPTGLGGPYCPTDPELLKTIRLMAEVKVVKRTVRQTPQLQRTLRPIKQELGIVAIGASTGGPPVLQTILSGLPESFPVPVAVVQHISPGFIEGMIRWLQPSCSLTLKIATDREEVRAGSVYFAPDMKHMGIDRSRRILLTDAPPEHGVRPSVSFLFNSVLEAYGSRAMGILLTGMGRDGAKEMLQMHKKGCITMAQDEDTCVVFGMPKEAIRLGGVSHVLTPEGILKQILLYCGKQSNGGIE
jgi:two-component system chemotaxis response regulator CheB